MFIVSIVDDKLKLFTTLIAATKYAEIESEKNITFDNDSCSYIIYPRVVIHELEMNIVYEQDYIQTEIYAIKKYNDSPKGF